MGLWRCPKCGFEQRALVRALSMQCPKGHDMQPVAGEEPTPTKGKRS